jgi:tetratricopeptide (TPR) repeat protein
LWAAPEPCSNDRVPRVSVAFLGIGVVLVAALGAAADLFRSRAQDHYARAQTYEDVYYLPAPDELLLASLGHRAALADLIWMKALVYFGDELANRGNVKNLFRYTDAMLALDETFTRVYRWVASAAIYRTGEVTIEDVKAAIRYLERGTRLFPDDPELAWDLGATYAYELVPMLPIGPAREEARRKSLDYLEMAALHGAGPAWLGLTTAGALDKLGRKEQAVRHLEDLYAVATDPAIKDALARKLTAMRTSAYVDAMRAANEELEAARRRDFPYLNPSLYMLVGKRPPVDGDGLRMRNFDPLAFQDAPPEGD